MVALEGAAQGGERLGPGPADAAEPLKVAEPRKQPLAALPRAVASPPPPPPLFSAACQDPPAGERPLFQENNQSQAPSGVTTLGLRDNLLQV